MELLRIKIFELKYREVKFWNLAFGNKILRIIILEFILWKSNIGIFAY